MLCHHWIQKTAFDHRSINRDLLNAYYVLSLACLGAGDRAVIETHAKETREIQGVLGAVKR